MFLPCVSSSIVVVTTAEPATFAFTYWQLHALLLFTHFQSADMCFALSIFLLQLSITCCQTRKLQLFDMLSHTVEATCSIFTHQTHRWTMEPRSINITRVGKHTLIIASMCLRNVLIVSNSIFSRFTIIIILLFDDIHTDFKLWK